ncbi:LytTR family DNA-binding domain-containing protein [Photobacterium sagamiensis]|uniref:LytR/AlgR family response regulator transcription factor n=1 Tax=Photobacterium sagamiensis TaxID=2910241 RepID=UPI003D0D2DC2
MDSYSALIIDDEPLLRRHLNLYLAELWPTLEIKGKAGNGAEALKQVEQYNPDLIFLDIRMPEMDGLTLAKKLSSRSPCPLIIFTTAYDQYAIDAFEQEAVDYLLKPIETKRLEKALDRAKRRLSNRAINQECVTPSIDLLANLVNRLQVQQDPQPLEWIKASRQETIHLLSVYDIHYFQAEDKYTTVVTADGEFVIRTSIKELNSQLDMKVFWQIHRGTLVNSAYIDKIERDFSGRMYVYLKTKAKKLAVSRNFHHLFKQM